MPKYKVLGNLTHNRKNYKVGDTVEMSAEQAEAIPWAVRKPTKTDEAEAKAKADADAKAKADAEAKAKADADAKAKAKERGN